MIKNKKHILFVATYMANGMNASAAYAVVYCKRKDDQSIDGNSARLMENVKVKAEIERLQKNLCDKLNITKEKIIEDLIYIKDKQKDMFPPSALNAIRIINDMLGYNMPKETKQDITVKGEQELFGPLNPLNSEPTQE